MLKIFLTTCIMMTLAITTLAQDQTKVQLANEYYLQNDTAIALQLYDELARNPANIPLIHTNYTDLLIRTRHLKEARKYLDKARKLFPDNIYYQIDAGLLEKIMGSEASAEKIFDNLISDVIYDQFRLNAVAQYFMMKQMPSYALKAYKQSRLASNLSTLYAMEIATIHQVMGNKDLMLDEYISFLSGNPRNINYIKNLLQTILTEEEDLKLLEDRLLIKTQEEPDKSIYSELLIWVNLQRQNFQSAFVQARALDRRTGSDGDRVMEVANIALQNEDFPNAIKMYSYIVEKHSGGVNYMMARRYLIEARERFVKKQYPIDRESIEVLIKEYDSLIFDLGINRYTLESMRNQALLYAFYLGEREKAITILGQVIDNNRSGATLIAQSKMDLGDIYILDGQPWESTLLYSQVEKTNKESQLGYEAKLRNARLHYFNGDFSLAQSHLDILKDATSRKISNDAIQLSLLIKDNTFLDSTDVVMQDYASVELLLYQNRDSEAREKLDSMMIAYEKHSISDELHYLKAKLARRAGDYEEAIGLLDKIVNKFDYDILTDDAYFMMAEIYEFDLKDTNRAAEIYRDLLDRFPGSIYVSDARKRFRQHRGDLIN